MSKKTVGKYEIGRTLGEGTFGKVKHAVNSETGNEVAIKVLDKERIQKQSMGPQIKKEISIMKQLEHPNVVKLKEVLASRSKIFIVLELVTGGELFDLIVKSGRLSEAEAQCYFRQLVEGVDYCHSKGVAHRDLKPENLLLDDSMRLKISDFGLSALYDGDEGASRSQMLHTTCGTPNYVAPEVLQNEGYDGRIADCWSIGVILYVLLAGFLPFDEQTMSALFAKIKEADYAYPKFFTQPVITLIDRILVADPKKRATLAQVKQDPWFVCDIEDVLLPPAPAPVHPVAAKVASTRILNVESHKPLSDVTAQLTAWLQNLGCDVMLSATADKDPNATTPSKHTIETSLITPNGLVSLSVLLSWNPTNMSTDIRLLRGKGDILAYTTFQAKLLDELKPVLNAV